MPSLRRDRRNSPGTAGPRSPLAPAPRGLSPRAGPRGPSGKEADSTFSLNCSATRVPSPSGLPTLLFRAFSFSGKELPYGNAARSEGRKALQELKNFGISSGKPGEPRNSQTVTRDPFLLAFPVHSGLRPLPSALRPPGLGSSAGLPGLRRGLPRHQQQKRRLHSPALTAPGCSSDAGTFGK